MSFKEAIGSLLVLENEIKKFEQQRLEWELERTELKVRYSSFKLETINKVERG